MAVADVALSQYWDSRLSIEHDSWPTEAMHLTPVDSPFSAFEISDIEFTGSGGDRIRGWLLRPPPADRTSVVIQFPGYGGGRGNVDEWLAYPAAGFTTVVMDVRGQLGATNDPRSARPHWPGFLTDGLQNPDDSYYGRLICDAVRCVDASLVSLNIESVTVGGFSQGGALALAAATLHGAVAAVAADSPFLCDIAESAKLASEGPYLELRGLLQRFPEREKELSEGSRAVDLTRLAPTGRGVPAMISSAGLDQVCPPDGVEKLAALWPGHTHLERFPYRGHVIPRGEYLRRQLEFFRQYC